MRRSIRRVVIATVLGMLLLTGCGIRTAKTEPAVGESQILFENQLEKDLLGMTIRKASAAEWAAIDAIPAGGTHLMDLDILPDGPGKYEVVCDDTDSWYYLLHDVPLEGGMRITLTSEGHTACITLTASDGSTRSIEGEAWEVEE